MKNIVNRALVAKKKQFLSKSVPRGTRTIWRYLGALFLILTLSIGQMWAATGDLLDLNFTAWYNDGGTTEGNAHYIHSKSSGDYKRSNVAYFTNSAYSKTTPTATNYVCVTCSTSTYNIYSKVNTYLSEAPDTYSDSYVVTHNSNTTAPTTVVFTLSSPAVIELLVGASSIGNTAATYGYTAPTANASKVQRDYHFLKTYDYATGSYPLADEIQLKSQNDIAYVTDTTTVAGTVSYEFSASNLYSTGGGNKKFYIYAIRVTTYSPCTKPTAPSNLNVDSKSHNSATLVWDGGSAGDNGYSIALTSSSGAGTFDWKDEGTATYTATNLTPETEYTFKVKYYGSGTQCTFSDEVTKTFTTDADPSATTYTVTLVPAGGAISDATGWTYDDVSGNYTKEVSEGSVLALPTFTKDNRTFKTWRNGAVDVTSPITVTADVTLTAVWNATVEQVIYSWESPDGTAVEVGGTAITKDQDGNTVEGNGNVNATLTNVTVAYKAIMLNGKISSNAWSGNYIQITTDEAVKAGDKVKVTACTTKGDTSKKGSAQMRAGASATSTAIFTDGNSYNDILADGTLSPNTKTFTVPDGVNTSTLTMTRSQSSTSCWVTKLQIIREVQVEEANIRTVTFNYNDGVTANVTVEVASGATVSAPADPTRAHYRFYEWQLSGVAYDFATAVTADITLVADWTQLYTVTYAKGEESATGDAPTQDELAAGEKFTVAANPFAYDGHDFSTWNDGSADVAPGTEYTMGAANVTLTAQWITATTKVTVTYKDGETTLGSEEITINTGNPVGYATYQTRNLATFDGWYNDPDLAEGHKIADISALTASADVNVYGKWNYQYASSTNIEQWILTNGAGKGSTTKTSALIAQLGTNKFASNLVWENGNIELDSLDDAKGDRNEPYLGLKVKSGGKMLDFRVANGQTVKVKFGAIKSTLPQVSLNGGDYASMSLTEKVWSYTATGNDYISIKTADANAVVFKQIMIDEPIAEVILPAIVTFDANGGTYADESVKYTGTALVIGNATPADEDHVFDGWYDGETKVNAAAYVPTKNVTLQAHYANKPYTVTYVGGEGATGTMNPVETAWGEDYTTLACIFEKVNHSFSTWAVVGVAGITEIAAGSSFVMPKGNVTLTAQWVNEALVARIGDNYYESLPEAVAAATNGQTVYLLKDVTAGPGVMIESANAKNITIDFGGFTYIVSTPAVGSTNTKTQGFHFEQGCTITMQNGTIGSTGDEVKMLVQNYCDLTLINIKLDGTDLAGTGRYTLSNNCGNVVIGNGAEIVAQAGGVAFDVCYYASYPSVSVTVLPGASIDGKIEMSMSNNKQGVEDNCQLIITGGEFENFSIDHTNIPEAGVNAAISAGTFDAPVENLYCAEGFVPTPEDPVTHKYTVEPKEGVEIIGAVVTGNTTADVTGAYKGTASVKLNNKKLDNGDYYFYVTLADGYTFEEGDVMVLDLNAKSDIGTGTKALEITTGVGNIDGAVWKSIAFEEYTAGENTIPLTGIAEGQTSIGLKRSANQNAKINGLRVLRPMKPMLTAITIDTRDGVINEAAKTVAVTIPYEADLAALTVVPTIVWNEAAASNSIVVNDGSAWIEGANTYKLTDKDGDYTVYTITLTRDVLKHAVKFYDGETLLETLEVENGTSIAAGDVPADPEKEDYLFQGWAETADGAAVDVTSFTISAAKNFYAKWAADGAIKLINKTSGAVNEDGYFITGVTATEANSEKAAAWGGTQGTSISGVNALGKIVQYNATTNQTKIKIKVYNTNGSNKYVYIHKVVEGKTTEEAVETLTATSNTVVESEYYEFNDTKNRSFYLTTNSTDVKILQVKVIDDGATPMKQAGEAGYSLNLNKGRVVYYGNSDVTFEGLALNSASNYSVISSSEFQTTKNISFSISSPVLLKVTTNTAKYYVSQNPDEDGTTATAVTAAGTAEFELTETTNPWYLVPSTTSNVKYTNIAFELPKAATPVIETQPATNHTFAPGDMTATVVATVTEGTLHYQWYKKATVGDDEEVGTDAATLTTTTEGTYYVVVTNTLAGHQDVSVTSEEAELGYRVTNDATLMALSYGGTAITLEDGVYNYNVELAKGTTDVPALAATATMDGYATVTISNAAEFVSYAASSTVTVKSEDATVTNVYTVNFTVKHDLPQVDVTATTTWNWANAATTMQKIVPAEKNVEQLMANIDDEGKKLKNDAEFNSQALIFSGQEALVGNSTRWYAKGGHIKFNVTVPGIVKVEFSDNGTNNRRLKINNYVSTESSASETDVKTYAAYVQPGEVTLMGVKNDGTGTDQYIRISKIEFIAKAAPDYTRTVSSNIGTLCVDHNVLVGGAIGATFYQIVGRNQEYSYKIDFEEVMPNEELKAGEPYIFQSTTGRIDLFYGETVQSEPIAYKGMIGNYDPNHLDITEENKADILYISQNKLWTCEDLVGVGLTLNEHRCYIKMSDVPEQNPGQQNNVRRRVTLGKNAEQVATGCENLNVSDKPVKMIINGQLFILRGEKMYDAKGQLVK